MTRDSLNSLLLTPPQPSTISRAIHGLGGVTTETFLLPDQWMLHFYHYSGRVRIRDHEFSLHPGCATLIPPATQIVFCYEGESPHLYSHFYLPPGSDPAPYYWPADPRVSALEDLLEGALTFHRTHSRRAAARLWEVLLGLSSLLDGGSADSQSQEKLDECLRLMNATTSTTLPIAELADEVGLSQNQLTRLFRSELGCTPVSYRRELKMDRACLLLRHSDLPVKAIACSVGIPDLQAFNKTFRKSRGVSPRQYRADPEGPLIFSQ
ncbi:helix-turn-helix transcriptional regulator [Puniceicoccus vermicola]|uniref:AraC family transcriptional regulator n=1 Tax=Puniceicoccus vermicola TaxID=388746 RepID=A0A7X1AXJ6_9BACT|nr:AraC family transcriptional regulator [Puniceicoccus vermicola]MBC2600823.1 AraC family transcriptional regulator [Puniceicoccus vermicola]